MADSGSNRPSGDAGEAWLFNLIDSDDLEESPRDHLFGPRYTEIRLITKTRVSLTYEARDRNTDAKVVIKHLHPQLLIDHPRSLEQFRQEVRIVAKLTSEEIIPHIIPICDNHLHEWPYFFAMPYCEGEHLDHYAQNLDTRQRLELFLELCDVVSHAHRKGVIHRDIKPNNVIVDRQGQPNLLDFGLGRRALAEASLDVSERGSVLGTPGYMAPEQTTDATHDTRSDIYALGVVLYELLTDALPVAAVPTESYKDMLERIRREEPRVPEARDGTTLGWELALVVLWALEKKPDDRYASVDDFAEALRCVLTHRAVPGLTDFGRRRFARVGDGPVPPRDGVYKVVRWTQRNSTYVTAGVAASIGIMAFTLWAFAMIRDKYLTKERDRHEYAVLAGRHWTERDDPARANRTLWSEYEKYPNEPLTRYALLEHYLRYPCLYHVSGYGAQRQVAYSPDGKWLVSVGRNGPDGGADGQLIVYRAADAKVVRVIAPIDACAQCIAFSFAGKWLYVGGKDGAIRRWPTEGLRKPNSPAPEPIWASKSGAPITAIAVSPDGAWLAVATTQVNPEVAGTPRGRVSVWRLEGASMAEKAAWTSEPLDSAVPDLAFSPCTTLVGAAALSGGWRVWQVEDGKAIAADPKDHAHCRSIRFHPDRRSIYVRTFVGDAEALAEVTIGGASGPGERTGRTTAQFVVATARNPSSTRMAPPPATHSTTLLPGAARVRWAIRSMDLFTHGDESYLVYSGGDGLIRFYDARNRRPLRINGYHDVPPGSDIDVCFAPDGRRVATVAADGLRIWAFNPPIHVDLPGSPRTSWKARSVVGAAEAPEVLLHHEVEGETLETGRDHLCWYNPNTGATRHWELPADHELVDIRQAALSVDGHFLAILGHAQDGSESGIGCVAVVDAASLETIATYTHTGLLPIKPRWIDQSSPCLLFAGGCGASGADASAGRAADLYAWRMVAPGVMADAPGRVLRAPEGRLTGFCAESAGNWIATTSTGGGGGRCAVFHDTSARIRNNKLAAYERVFTTSTHVYCWAPAFVRDASDALLVAVGGSTLDKNIKLFNVATQAAEGAMHGHRDNINECAPLGGPLLVTSSYDQRVLLWDVAIHKEVCELHRAINGLATIDVQDERVSILEGDALTIVDLGEAHRKFVLRRKRPYASGSSPRTSRPNTAEVSP